jgi:hypothetical protein
VRVVVPTHECERPDIYIAMRLQFIAFVEAKKNREKRRKEQIMRRDRRS